MGSYLKVSTQLPHHVVRQLKIKVEWKSRIYRKLPLYVKRVEETSVVANDLPFRLVVVKSFKECLVILLSIFGRSTIRYVFQEVFRIVQRVSLPSLRDHFVD